MKSILRLTIFISVMLISALSAIGRTWKVDAVVNPRTADSTCFVVNPDRVLSPATEARLNAALRKLQRETTAEVTVVAIDSIDPSMDIDTYATRLFNLWGVGKKDTDNGLMLLLSRGTHEVTIRTGRGTEGVVPDIVAGRIIREDMIPRFRHDDYDGGVERAVDRIACLFAGDESIRSGNPNNQGADGAFENPGDIFFSLYLKLAMLSGVVMLIIVVWKIRNTRRLNDGDRWRELEKFATPALFMVFMGLLAPLPAWLILRHKLKRLRDHSRVCSRCGTTMARLNEQADNEYLNSAQDAEERVNSIDYDVWLCPKCQNTEVIPYINRSSAYTECPHCKARTFHLNSTSTLRAATPLREGEGVKNYSCAHCGYKEQKRFSIPKVVVVPVTRRRGGNGFGGGFGGGGFGGGSFGGGRSMGGGATGRW